jgi:hypothetical protein
MTTAARVRLGEDLAGRAVALLVKAKAASYFNDSVKREGLENDSAFADLRGRKDFAALLAALEKSNDVAK